MKNIRTLIPAAAALCAAASPALAANETAYTYNSGVLVLVFLAVCAVILVAQLIPTIVMLMGWAKALVTGEGKAKKAKAAVK
jgi:hypothetical protein